MRIGGDRGELEIAEAVLEIDVGEHEVVGELLLELGELTAATERHRRTRGGEGVGEDVVLVAPVPPVDRHALVDEARRDRQTFVGGEDHGRSQPAAEAVVHVLDGAEIRLNRIDEARDPIVVGGEAQRGLPAERRVEAELAGEAGIAAVDAVDSELGERLRDADLRLIGDVADRARQRARAEQRALRAAQHLDAIGVEEIEIGREERERDDRLVEVDADLLLHARLVPDDLSRRDAAHRNLALARPEVLHGKARDVCRDAFEILDAARAQELLGRGGDREGHIQHRLLALRRGDGDLLAERRLERKVELTRTGGLDLDGLHDTLEARSSVAVTV